MMKARGREKMMFRKKLTLLPSTTRKYLEYIYHKDDLA
jgi:hypothetical protein